MNESNITRKIRAILGFSTTEMAKFMHRTKRTIEHWEADSFRIPDASLELMIIKMQEQCKDVPYPPIIILDGVGKPWDVVTPKTFVSLCVVPVEPEKPELLLLRTLAISREGEAYIHATYFGSEVGSNKSVYETIAFWPATTSAKGFIISRRVISPIHPIGETHGN